MMRCGSNQIRTFTDTKARSHFLSLKGVLTLGRFTVNNLSTTVMLTVYCDLHEAYISDREN